jgi:hypothetical protein
MAVSVAWIATLLLLVSVTCSVLETCEAFGEDWDESYIAETKNRLAKIISRVKPAGSRKSTKEDTVTAEANHESYHAKASDRIKNHRLRESWKQWKSADAGQNF